MRYDFVMMTINEEDPDFFSRNIPIWNDALAPYKGKKDLRFVEVGSLYGRSAAWLLTNILTDPSSTLMCIDLFAQSYESLAYCRLLDLIELSLRIPGKDRFDRQFDERMATIGATKRVIKRMEDSETALRSLPLASYDCVYVDGSHSSRNVLTDLVLSWGILKMGGLLIIDDYTLDLFKDNPLKNPIIGINAFLSVFRDEYETVYSGPQVILRKTAHKDDVWRTKSARSAP